MPRIPNTITHPKRGKLSCRIYDDGGETNDRYTACLKAYRPNVPGYGLSYPYLAFDENPFHPQGFGQFNESREKIDGKHLGKRIAFSDLPKQAQQYVLQMI